MNEPQLYLNLVNRLLTCDEGGEGEILRENADLVDAELVAMMERVVSVLEERDAKQQAEWLQELANRLGGSLEMPSVDGREEREVYQQVRSLERRFGKGHLYFAYHAAFPLALTPDLCYQIWANFQRDVEGNLLDIPWIGVADLLLSGLCRPVGHELYEMDLAVRNLLLKELRNHFNFGEGRIEELSEFMLKYVREQINSEDEDVRDFATVQKWTALAYVKPDEAAQELALTLREKVREGNKAELVRLASVLENLAEPLGGEYEPLLVYGRGMGRLARGDSEGASREFQGLGEIVDLSVSGVRLPIPSGVGDGDVFGDLALRFGWRRDNLDLIQLLLNCAAGEEGEVLRRHQHLVDSVLVEMMRRVAASLREVGEGKAAEFLVAVADALVEAFDSARNDDAIAAFLAELIRTSKEEDTRLVAAENLGIIAQGSETAIAALAELIRISKDEDTLRRAAESLGKIGQGNETAIAALVELIGISQSGYTRWQVAESLGKIGQGNETAIAALGKLIHTSKDEDTLRGVAEILGKIGQGNETAIAALVELIRTSKDEDTLLRVVWGLEKIGQGSHPAIIALIEIIGNSQSKNIRGEAIWSLGEVARGNDIAIAFLVELIHTFESEDTIREAVRSLGKMGQGNAVAIAALVELIGTSESANIRWKAARSLGKIGLGNDTAIAALVELIGTSKDENALEQALWSLEKISQSRDRRDPGTIALPVTHQNPAAKRLSLAEFLNQKTWILKYSLVGHSDFTKTFAISPDNKILASGGPDKIIKLWNLETGEPIGELTEYSSAIISLAFSHDGKTLASASNMEFMDGTIKLWDTDTWKVKQTLGTSLVALRTAAIAFSRDDRSLATAHLGATVPFDAGINIWHLDTGKKVRTLRGHSWEARSIAFTPDGRLLVSGGADGAIKIWNWHNGKLLKTLNRPEPSNVAGSVAAWFDSSGELIWCIDISPNGQVVASGDSKGLINLWDIQTQKLLRSLSEHSDSVNGLAFSPDGEILASASNDYTVKIWNVATGELLHALEHQSRVHCVAFSSDGKTLVSGSSDQTIRVWRRLRP